MDVFVTIFKKHEIKQKKMKKLSFNKREQVTKTKNN
jgi:hypothetical protein